MKYCLILVLLLAGCGNNHPVSANGASIAAQVCQKLNLDLIEVSSATICTDPVYKGCKGWSEQVYANCSNRMQVTFTVN
jgi:hypothetical protein